MAPDDAEGIEIRSDVALTWKKAGMLGNAGTFKEAKGAAGLYAFVLDGRPLYVGKSGGLKPGSNSLWVKRDLGTRPSDHWKSGLLRGLVKVTHSLIEVWFIDMKAVDRIWERDIELVENALIGWMQKWDPQSLPGNTAIAGSSPRRFEVAFHMADGPLPSVTLLPGHSADTRRKRRRKAT